MIFEREEEVFKFIKRHMQTPKWVEDARKNHKVLNALVLGKDFDEVLITKIEKIESKDRQTARKKYSKDIRDMFHRVMQPRTSVFSAAGGSVKIEIPSEKNKEKFVKHLSEFKGQKSIKKYLSENFFRLEDTDPNGLLFLEYVKDEKIAPTYKSINDIRTYISDGQLLEVLMFEPKILKPKHGSNAAITEFRVVDDKKDWRIQQNGSIFTVIEDRTFEHPFGRVPGTILSDIQVTGSELRVSPLFFIEELSKDYARDKSILTIYKFLHGFPRHWRYESKCRPCQGTGKDGSKACKVCDGKGNLRVNDVTDITTIEMPREDDQLITPNVEGFVSPDLETWTQYNEDLISGEERIESTMWGTRRLKDGGGSETATGRFIDVQPVINRLNFFTDNVQWTHNQLAHFLENWVNGMPVEESMYHKTYGRRYILESPDVILDKYTKSRKEGDNNTILDKLLDEYILSMYQSNPMMLVEMQKKRLVEPYLHQAILDVSNMFGNVEANKKVVFVDFWEQADKKRTTEELKKDFDKFFTTNNQILPPPPPSEGEPTK